VTTSPAEANHPVDPDQEAAFDPALERALDNLPKDERDLIVGVIERSISYSGPLPPPHILREFEEILPGAADRCFKMAEREQNHLHAIQNKLADADIATQSSALTSVFILAAITLVGGIVLIALGRDIAGFAFIATVLAAIGAVYWRRQMDKAKSAKNADAPENQDGEPAQTP